MTVFSKVLYGTMLVSSYDKQDYSTPTTEANFQEPIPVTVRTTDNVFLNVIDIFEDT